MKQLDLVDAIGAATAITSRPTVSHPPDPATVETFLTAASAPPGSLCTLHVPFAPATVIVPMERGPLAVCAECWPHLRTLLSARTTETHTTPETDHAR